MCGKDIWEDFLESVLLDLCVYSSTILLERNKACDLLRTTDFSWAESHPTVDVMRPKIVAK